MQLLEWHLVFNKGSVMALPAGITKASGPTPALEQLRVPAERTAGVGDAENDHSFLRMCGFAAAVANALPAIKADVDWVAPGAAGEGVRQLIDRMLAEPGDPRQIRIA
jgi:hydroxymethylpyrimidine pyrophosphatase-like HAD family hydrolase